MFCGVGGLTCGLKKAGLNVIAGIDIDPTYRYTYVHNNHVPYYEKNIREVDADYINQLYRDGTVKILVGCAPYQPFSQMRYKLKEANESDEKYNLLLEFGRLIEEVKPTIISMENVPQIGNTLIFQQFIDIFDRNG